MSNPTAVVVGHGPASARAALDLARAGVGVTLLSSADWLAPQPRIAGSTPQPGMAGSTPQPGMAGSTPQPGMTGSTPQASFAGLADVPLLLETARHPRVELLTGAQVAAVEILDRTPRSSPRRGRAHLRLTVHQAPRFVDPERCTACGACVEVCPVELPGEEMTGAAFATGAPLKAIHRGGVPTSFAIHKAGTAPCRHACPIDQRAQGYVALARAGRWEAAYRAIKRENPFPSVCGRVCNHRCEEACTRCQVDEPVAVMAIKRFVSDWALENGVSLQAPVADRTGWRVGIVGAGPAGLTAARELNRMGHNVTVFEALPVTGGMMRVGIPAFRLPRQRLAWEIDDILAEGVNLRTNYRVDSVQTLFEQGFNAVILAVGLHRSRRMAIPGAEEPASGREEGEPGVMGAVEFLRDINLGERPDWRGRQVVVVGGGSTAMDTARICRRLGADVQVIYRRSRVEMPAHDFEVTDAESEGVTLRLLANPTRVLREGGRVVAVACVEMRLGEPDASGRRRPIPVAGSAFSVPADVVLMAIGQDSDLTLLGGIDGVVAQRGVIDHARDTLMTGRAGLFVAGDVAGTDGFVVDAIANGLQVARSVDRYLRGDAGAGEIPLQPVVALDDLQLAARLAGAAGAGTPRARTRSTVPEKLLGDFQETELGLTEAEVVAEAARCLSCGLCAECLACEEVCAASAIDHAKTAQVFQLEADVGIWAEEHVPVAADRPGVWVLEEGYAVSEVVDRALHFLGLARPRPFLPVAAPHKPLAGFDPAHPTRALGLFLCQCGGEIGRTVDLAAVADRLQSWSHPVYVEQIPFACHPEGGQAIRASMTERGLDGGVLAACSCCALDQICYSCTTQRIRCKEQLGLWDQLGGLPLHFVNVREQCAFVHRDNPAAATRKAGDLVASALAALDCGQALYGAAPRWPITAVVEPLRCRGCEDCEVVCGMDAMHVVAENGARLAHVDASRCLGCGVCMAVCSSGAILAGDTADAQAEAMLAAMGDLEAKTVVFSCNWGAYSAVEAAGVHKLAYDPSVRLIRLMCAGRAHAGLILRAFAQGAARVLVLVCGDDGETPLCHYQTGNAQAARSVAQAQQLLGLLGVDPARLALVELGHGDGGGFVRAVSEFVADARRPLPGG